VIVSRARCHQPPTEADLSLVPFSQWTCKVARETITTRPEIHSCPIAVKGARVSLPSRSHVLELIPTDSRLSYSHSKALPFFQRSIRTTGQRLDRDPGSVILSRFVIETSPLLDISPEQLVPGVTPSGLSALRTPIASALDSFCCSTQVVAKVFSSRRHGILRRLSSRGRNGREGRPKNFRYRRDTNRDRFSNGWYPLVNRQLANESETRGA
jgi:hypothetical protein